MKLFLRFVLTIALIQFSIVLWGQPCASSPAISATATVTDVTSTSAILGGSVLDDGGVDCSLAETGIEWSTTAGGPYTTVTGTQTTPGAFTVDVTGLPVATRIYFRAYARNDNANNTDGTRYSGEEDFYTLATEPGVHAANLSATALDNNEIYLQFPPAGDISDADGYVILMRSGSNPGTNNLNDGAAPGSATDFLHLLSSTSVTDYTVSGLTSNQEYHFTIIPYNRSGNDATYNYRVSAGYPFATATTEPEVDISAITGGLATPSPTPLNGGTANLALAGFSLNATGPMTFQSVVIHLSSTTAGKFTNFRLCSSSNGTFDGIATDTPLTTGVTINVSGSAITITLSQALASTPTRNFFLIGDVAATVNGSTPSVTFSYDQTDFTFNPNNIDGPASQSRTYNFADVTPPVLVSTVPADNATGVNFNLSKLTMTFNENIDNITTASSTNDHRVIIYDDATDLPVLTVARASVVASGTTVAEVNIPPGTLEPNTNYYVLVGNGVLEDVPADIDWAGISSQTTWNFTTSGVVVNNATSDICGGSFQAIADIVISEEAEGDFLSSGSINLDFADANFGYDISSVSVTAGPAGNTDITSVSLSPKTLTRLTLNVTLDGSPNRIDVITISGLKVYASTPGSTTIYNANSVSGVWAIDQPVTFATINVGASAPSPPVLETSPAQQLLFCKDENISSATIAVENDGGTFAWYANESLSTQLATGHQVDVAADLGINSSVTGVVSRYAVRIDGCQSQPLKVEFEVAPVPIADAGLPNVTVCSGSSITLGGSPTLTGPSASGAYQYLWSTNAPDDFIDMGPNPVVTPIYHTDTTFNYTVKIVDANGCASDILDPNATIAVNVDSTDEVIVYNSPLTTTFTLNSDPIELNATPSINSSYSGNGVYLSNGKYYFDPDLAGVSGATPHNITYTTQLTNGCPKSDIRQFAVSSSSGSIVNLASSYCSDEIANPSKVLSLGPDWSANLATNNAYYLANYGYTYEFYDFQAYTINGTPGPGVVGNVSSGQPQYIQPNGTSPNGLQPFEPGANYTYVGVRVRRHVPAVVGPLGIVLVPESWDPPVFWAIQYVGLYTIPDLKIGGIRNGQTLCDLDETIELEANFNSGTYQISRDNINWVSGPSVGLVDNPVNSGKALFNPHDAFASTAFPAPHDDPATDVQNFYIRYTYIVPNTSGSTSAACEGSTTVAFEISPNPSVSWTPFAETEFCYESPTISISTVSPSGANNSQKDVITGFGILDKGNRTATFDPDEALKAKAFATNSPPFTDYDSPEDIVISATRTDKNGCFTTITQTVQVHPLFPASFTESDLDVCHEDNAQNIVGGQSGYFQLTHPNLTVNFAQPTINGFNLRTHFNNAVANGADGTVTQKFNLTFYASDPLLGCANSVSKTFTVSPPVELNIVGMTPSMVVCGNAVPMSLEGNVAGAGTFEISNTSPTSGFVNEAYGLDNTTPGYAVYTPSGAGLAPGSLPKSYYIRYSYQAPGCAVPARTTEEIVVNPQPAISFSSAIPAPNTAYCHEQAAVPTTIVLTTNQTANISFSGHGITDNGNGSAIFNPTSAYQQSSLADNQNPQIDQTVRNIAIKASRTDALGCVNSTSVNYVVNPLPLASFTPPEVEFCYEDSEVLLSGGQTNVSWQFIYKNTTPPNYSAPVIVQSTTPFNPADRFDEAVSLGANGLATLQFDVIYTAINNTTGCVHKLAPVTLSVSPRIPVAISGVEPGEIFCSNIADKTLEFSPPGGTFRINGVPEPTIDNKFIFNPQLHGPEGGTQYTFTYTVVTGNNCANTLNKTVNVLPSPRALFDVDPQCEGEIISYQAESSTNLPSATYTWIFSGETKTGQTVEHQFPGVSSYYAKLKVEHPPFVVNANTTLVCVDSLQQDQIVGPYPKDIRFEYFDVCEGDDTQFEVISNVPINRVAWDFGDGETTGFGILSENIIGLPKTTGAYQQPVHTFTGAYDAVVVSVEGKTSDDFGGCPFTYARPISILKKWVPSGPELRYDMSELDNGKGFWVVEDDQGNATWEFATASKQVIQTDEMTWVTGGSDPYKGNDISYVNSPCFDLSSFSRPVISIKHWTDTEASDGAVLQYSIDGGENWTRLGDVGSGLEWYNRLTISSNPGEQVDLSSGWSLTNQQDWLTGKHTLDVLPPQRGKVRFRIAFASFNNRDQRDGFAFNDVVIEERNRTILVENFTTLNPEQTVNNSRFNQFRAPGGVFNPQELVKLQYHHAPAQNNYNLDELHLANPVDQNARAAFYGLNGPMRAFVDGGFGQLSPASTFQSPDLDLFFSLRSLVTSPVDIAIDFMSEPADRLSVKATVQATHNLGSAGKYNVFIAIAEQFMDNNNQVFYVLRKLLPDASGIPLTSFSPGSPAQEINVSYDMRHVTRLPNGEYAPFGVIVFVQHLETKDVLQTVMRQDGSAPPQVVTGIETPFDNYIKIYPNPADKILNIILPAPAQEDTPVKVFDTFGRQVYSGLCKEGEYITTLETTALSAGIYLIHISTGQGVVQKKAIVVHD